MVEITSGFGVRTAARVGEQGRLWVDSQMNTEEERASLAGRNFVIYTGTITITSSAQWAPLYIKNTGVNDLVIHRIYFDLGVHAPAGVSNIFGSVVRNPTAGGPLVNKVPVDFGLDLDGNTNFGSTNRISAIAYKGSQADGDFTASDGRIGQILVPIAVASTFYEIRSIVLTPNTSFGLTNTPHAGTTSQETNFGIHMYERTNEITGITKV